MNQGPPPRRASRSGSSRPAWLEVPDYVRIKPDLPPPDLGAAVHRHTLPTSAASTSERVAARREGGRWQRRIVDVVTGAAAVGLVALGLRAVAARSSAAEPAAVPPAPTRVVGGASPERGAAALAVRAAGADEAPPDETPAEPTASPSPPAEALIPVVPTIDAEMRARLAEVAAVGRSRGLSEAVFAKVGDSITASPHFLAEVGCPGAALGADDALEAIIGHFGGPVSGLGTASACADVNAFTRQSQAAGVGWVAAQVLTPMAEPPEGCHAPNDTPLRCEIAQTRASIALVMLGTNDLHQGVTLPSYRASLTMVVDELFDAGVIPVLSTIPPRLDSRAANARVGDYNAVVRAVADERRAPLWNYWRALSAPDMIDSGMAPDGVHPSAYGGGAVLGGEGLRYGYNQRNLTALQVLEALRRDVFSSTPSS